MMDIVMALVAMIAMGAGLHRGPLDWRVGDRASYTIAAAVARGTAEQSVRQETSDGFWTLTEIDMGLLGRQKIEILYNKSTGAIRKLLVNGREQQPPDPSDLDVVESRFESVRVPAGEFDSVYSKMRNRRDGKIQEGWSNPQLVPIGGMIKAKGESTVGAVTQELRAFSFVPRL